MRSTLFLTSALLLLTATSLPFVKAQGDNDDFRQSDFDNTGRRGDFDDSGNTIRGGFNQVGNGFNQVGNGIRDGVVGTGHVIQNGFNQFGQRVDQFGHTIQNGVVNTVHRAEDGTLEAVDKAEDGLETATKTTGDGINGFFHKTEDGIKSAGHKVKNFFKGIFHKADDEVDEHAPALKGVAAGVGTGLAVGMFNPVAGIIAGTAVGAGVAAHKKHERQEDRNNRMARDVDNFQRDQAFGVPQFIPPPVFGGTPARHLDNGFNTFQNNQNPGNNVNFAAINVNMGHGPAVVPNYYNNRGRPASWDSMRPNNGGNGGFTDGSAMYETRNSGAYVYGQ